MCFFKVYNFISQQIIKKNYEYERSNRFSFNELE